MPIQVQGPDGQEYEFPDGTSRDVMKAAMAKRYAAPTKAAPAAKPKPARKSLIPNPMGDPVLGFLGGAVDGLQHHLANIPVAIAQAGANTGDWIGEKLGIPKSADNFADRMNAGVRKREADYQQRTDGNAGSYVGAAAGEVLPWMVGMGGLRTAGMLPQVAGTGVKATAKKGALLAAEGAAMGAAQPVVKDGSYGAQKAAQIGVGAVAAPVIAGGTKAVGAGARYLTPSGRDAIANKRLAELYGTDEATLAALRKESAIPGYNFTAAQRLATPEAVQAERMLRNQGNTGPAFARQESANNAALRAEAQRLAGDDGAMEAAKQARTAATDPFYAQLEGKALDPAPVETALKALRESGLGVRQNIKGAVDGLLREIDSRRLPDGTIDAGVLSALRENIGSFLGPMASAQEKRALVPIKNTIVDALDGAVPGYRDNLAAYARLSQPISDMEKGRALLGAIDSGGRDAGGNQAVSLTQLKTMLSRDAKSRYPMSPEARQTAQAMLDALQTRSVTNNTIAASGPGTAADGIRGSLESPAGQWAQGGLAALLGGAAGGVDGGLLALLATGGVKAANNNVMSRVGTKAADASLTAEAIEAYIRSQNPALSYSPLLRLLPYQPTP